MFWLHTYNRATCSRPQVEGHGRERRVTWTLSEPAPETWWAVLRARGADDFEGVARVRAGPGLEMSWTDRAPPAGLLRYKIPRESVDARYRWESEAVRVPERSRGLALHAISTAVSSPHVLLELDGAATGPVEVRLYDLQGRAVLVQRGLASGLGRDTVRLDLAAATRPLPTGVYFAAARDAAGDWSGAVKIVILR